LVLASEDAHGVEFHDFLKPNHNDVWLITIQLALKDGDKFLEGLWLAASAVESNDLHGCLLCYSRLPIVLLNHHARSHLVAEHMLAREDHDALLFEVVRDVLFQEPLHRSNTLVYVIEDGLLALGSKSLVQCISACIDFRNEITAKSPHLNH
jgi:hypothetical protein